MGCCETTPSSTCSTSPSSCDTGKKDCCAKLKCAGQCLGALFLRLTLAAALLPHGVQKLQHWDNTYHFFTDNLHIPAPLAVIGILAEVVFPILLILGLFTRLAALGLAIHLATAAVLGGHLANGFFANWFRQVGVDGKALGEGYEYHLLYVGAALALVLVGPGKVALDSVLCCLIGKKKGCCTK